MVDDLNHKLADTIKKMQRQITRLLSARWLENASVRSGRLRFIGGILRLDSGALLELIGQWRFFGNGAITGDVFSEGTWTQVGPWDFTGDGDLAGDVKLTGNFDLLGEFKAGNILIKDGKIYVGLAGTQIVIDGATGKVTAGNVTIEQNKITIAGADGPTVLQDSRMDLNNGSSVRADAAGLQITQGNAQAAVFAGLARLRAGVRSFTISDAGGYTMAGLPTRPSSTSNSAPVGTVWSDAGGNLYRVVSG